MRVESKKGLLLSSDSSFEDCRPLVIVGSIWKDVFHGTPSLPAPLPGRWSDVVHKGKQGRTQAHLLQDQKS